MKHEDIARALILNGYEDGSTSNTANRTHLLRLSNDTQGTEGSPSQRQIAIVQSHANDELDNVCMRLLHQSKAKVCRGCVRYCPQGCLQSNSITCSASMII